MPKETKAQREKRYAETLADYDNAATTLRKLEADMKTLKERVREIPPGTYGEWSREDGTPRTIMDQEKVRRDYAERGVDMPTVQTKPPLVVKWVGTK